MASLRVSASPAVGTSTLTVDGVEAPNGEPSEPVVLPGGQTTAIEVVCTAEDGETSARYVVGFDAHTIDRFMAYWPAWLVDGIHTYM